MTRRPLLMLLQVATTAALAATAYPLALTSSRADEARAVKLVDESRALSAKGQTAAAEAKLDDALRLAPDNLKAHRDKGVALLAAGRSDEGAAELRYAAEGDPDGLGAAWEYAFALSATSQFEKAATWFKHVTVLEPNNGAAYAMLATSELQLGHKEAALPYAEKGAHCSPRVPLTQFTLGIVRWQMGDREGGRTALEEAFRLQPSDPKKLLALLTLSRELNRPDLAEGYLQRALATAPNNATFWLALGQAQLAQKKLPAAAEAFRHALQLDPTNAAAQEGLKAAGG